MKNNEKIERLMLVVTNLRRNGLDMKQLTQLAYLGTVAQQGFWATIQAPVGLEKDGIWNSFICGSASGSEKRLPFWQILDEAGRKVILGRIDKVPNTLPSSTPDEIRQIVEGGDWRFLMTSVPHELGTNIADENKSEYWQKLDREIESIALAADIETTLMVLALPVSNREDGWVVVGGANIAPLGNPGPMQLIDLAPTILWLLGVDTSHEMLGQILDDILVVESDLTQEEVDILTDHLRGLGYLG